MELGKTMKVVNVVDAEDKARFVEPAASEMTMVVTEDAKVEVHA